MMERIKAVDLKGKRRDREAPIQAEIVDWLRKALPGAVVHHCKNEINKSGRQFAREQAKAKWMGAVPGFPDLIVIARRGVMFLEVKAPKNYATKTQRALHADLQALGYRVAVVRSIDDVRDCLKLWGVNWLEPVEFRGTINKP